MRLIDVDEYIKYLNKLREICEKYGDLKSATRYQEAINEINKLHTVEGNVVVLEELREIIKFKVLTEQKQFLDSSFSNDDVFRQGVAFGIGACLGIVLKTLEETEKNNGS